MLLKRSRGVKPARLGGLDPILVRSAIDRAFQRSGEDGRRKQSLRAAIRYVREALEAALYAVLLTEPGAEWSARYAADRVFELLLELEALDLQGVADLLRSGSEKQIRALRRKYRRPVVRPAELSTRTLKGPTG